MIRLPRYNSKGTIDCVIEHPTYGPVPFTASPNDPEEHGRQIYAALLRGEFGTIADAGPAADPKPRPKSEIEELRDLVEILVEAMPNKTPQVTEALARVTARKAARPATVGPGVTG